MFIIMRKPYLNTYQRELIRICPECLEAKVLDLGLKVRILLRQFEKEFIKTKLYKILVKLASIENHLVTIKK